jgi:hypothetical protein
MLIKAIYQLEMAVYFVDNASSLLKISFVTNQITIGEDYLVGL